jgi:hypothetical protein
METNTPKSIAVKNLLQLAENSCGSNLFKNFFVNEKDILANGDLSCAWFVSTVLVMIRLLDGVSFTVNGLIARLKGSQDWVEEKFQNEIQIEDLQPGDIILWNPIPFKKGSHYHVGIYLGDEVAVSNRSLSGQPGKHGVKYTGLSDTHQLNEVSLFTVFRLREDL